MSRSKKPLKTIETGPPPAQDATRIAEPNPDTSSRLARAAWGFSRTVPTPKVTEPLKEASDYFASFQIRHDLSRSQVHQVLARLATAYSTEFEDLFPLPKVAPETWTDRDLNKRETPPDFIRRVYAPWVGKGLSRKDLKQLDPSLYRALSVWLTRHPEDQMAKSLPTQSDILNDLIDRLTDEFSLEDLRKLGYAIDARLKRQRDA